jgi:hypothetical protein
MQYTRRDWRNRNVIKTKDGLKWLTIPVENKGKFLQAIKDTRVSGRQWAADHWKSLGHAYARARYWPDYREALESLYRDCAVETQLSLINRKWIDWICGAMGIQTRISWSMDFGTLPEDRNQKLIALCQKAGADRYLSGPAARDYLDETQFRKAGIEVVWMDYSGYSEYSQLHGAFIPHVSVLDLLLNEGPNANLFLKKGLSGLS